MPLDLSQMAAHIEGLAAKVKVEEKEREERLERALKLVHTVDVDSLKRKLASSKTSWLVCGLTDGLAQQFKVPPCPEGFTVLATDGSHIDVDRHSSVRCYLINIGSALLHYGEDPDAQPHHDTQHEVAQHDRLQNQRPCIPERRHRLHENVHVSLLA